MNLVGYNKRVLNVAVGATGSTYDSRLLRNAKLFNDILKGDAIADRQIALGDFGNIPLVTMVATHFQSSFGYFRVRMKTQATYNSIILIGNSEMLE